MQGHQKRWLALWLVVIVLLSVGVNERKIRICYHNACIRLAGRHLQVMSGVSATGAPPQASGYIEDQFLRFCYGGNFSAANSIQAHTDALLGMGFFTREEFVLRYRLIYEGTNRAVFRNELAKEFGVFGTPEANRSDWWSMQVPASNRVAVVTTPAQMVRWRKLVEKFDQPEQNANSKSNTQTQ
jgi:hypothetical protein